MTTTSKEVEGDVNDVNLQKMSTQTVTRESDMELHTTTGAINECFDADFDDSSAQTTKSVTTKL